MVACSPVDVAAGREGSAAGAGGVWRMGSGVGAGEDGPDWVGFHIALKRNSFSVRMGRFSKAGLNYVTQNSNCVVPRAVAYTG